jgi:pyruvate formate lyase activating enzyme
MKIVGVEKDSMVEWPGKVSYVVFLAGCNFKCPFCYVPNLVLPERYNSLPEIKQEQVLKELAVRSEYGWTDAVCITGGEPTINNELFSFLDRIRKQAPSLLIKLETNGSNPDILEKLIRQNLVDSISMDIKNSREKYLQTCNCSGTGNIEESISLLKSSGIDHEFRTTLVPGLHNESDMRSIIEWVYGLSPKQKIKHYVLQQFRNDLPKQETLDKLFIQKKNFSLQDLQKIHHSLIQLGYIEKLEIRAS